jgi:hypothetical protein
VKSALGWGLGCAGMEFEIQVGWAWDGAWMGLGIHFATDLRGSPVGASAIANLPTL